MRIVLPHWVKRANQTRDAEERAERLTRATRRLGPQYRQPDAMREDGTRFTRTSAGARRAANRRRNRCARVARRFNRKET